MLKAKLSVKFYFVSALLLAMIVFCCYGIYFLNTTLILDENNVPIGKGTRLILTFLMCVVLLSWIISLITMIRQIFLQSAFTMDENGIHNTASAIMILAFIFVIPIKQIPYDAIQTVSEKNGILTVKMVKSKIKTVPFLKFFVRSEYHFFSGFTQEKSDNIKEFLNKFNKT